MTALETLHRDLDPESSVVSRARAWRNVGLFLAMFCGTLWALRELLPERGWMYSDAKLEGFAGQADETDLIFLGSSRTYRGFVPEIFEQVLAEHGHVLRAYNMGIMGNRATESLEVLKRIGRTNPGRLSWVLVDTESIDMLLEERHQRSRRTIAWHDAQASADVARLILASDLDRGQKIEKLWQHWIAFAYHELNVGMAQPWLNDLLGQGLSAASRAEYLGPRSDGYRPTNGTIAERAANGEQVSKQLLQQFPAQVERLKNRLKRFRPAKPPMDPLRAIFYKRFETLAASLGAQTVFVVQPTVVLRSGTQRAATQGLIEHCLNYNDPSAYPELYTLESRNDLGHASPAGAELFTHQLALDFIAILESEDQAQ